VAQRETGKGLQVLEGPSRRRCLQPRYDALAEHLDWWRARLEYYGGAPTHLATLQAFTQAVEIADHLMCRTGIELIRILYALPFWVCRARQSGRVIRSLAFIAEELARMTDEGESGSTPFPPRCPRRSWCRPASSHSKPPTRSKS
jgi:hypothetical protein